MYYCEVLADSINPAGNRLTTLCVTFPRFILAEINTHRALSRNSASSRAIPPEKLIQEVEDHPFIPTFNARVKGMGVGAPLQEGESHVAKLFWLASRDQAIASAQMLIYVDVDKSRINRLLEPFMWHTAIISATEWENFFNLRCHADAQPEIQQTAKLMRDAIDDSTPNRLEWGEWHLPLVTEWEREHGGQGVWLAPAKISAGRCARVSYKTHKNEEIAEESISRWNRLQSSGHWSPAEHPAKAVANECIGRDLGNYKGFRQLRKFYLDEKVFRG